MCKDISRDYDIQIDFSHVSGVLNFADYNSKTAVDVNPVDLVNSSEWRHGNVGFTNDVFLGEEMIFLKYINSVMVKYQQPKVDQTLAAKITWCTDGTDQTMPSIALVHFSVYNQSFELFDMISYLPVLPEKQYRHFIQSKHLVQTVRLLSRILIAALPKELLDKMKCVDYRQTNRADFKKNLRGLAEFLPKETSSVLMKLAFLVLVKTSNALYTPKRATEIAGLYIHRTRYSAPAMNAIFQSQVLPIISSQYKHLLKRLYEHSHIKSTSGRRMHIPIGLTMIRSKQGVRRIFKAFADKKLGKYAYRLSDPRLTTFLAQQNPIWHTVSIDLIGNFTLSQFRSARGKHSTYKAWGLFFTDLASGLCDIQMMDGSTAEHCTRAITTFANKNQIPAKIVVDAEPQLKSLTNNPVFTAATNMGINVEPVAPHHQFLNFAERQIQILMKRSLDRSIYDQGDTLLDLMEKFSMVHKVMSLRPILIKHTDQEETVILACQLSNPTLSSKNVEDMMKSILLGKESVQAQLFASIFYYKESILTAYHQ